ncbi:MAG: helix-turn-helix transcriptional regulator [Candidatus Sericytochromatia bacterium]
MTKSKGEAGVDHEEGITGGDILDADDLERLTGTKASTWRYWAHIGSGPPSFKLGRRRVWAKSEAMAWIAEQRQATGTGGTR